MQYSDFVVKICDFSMFLMLATAGLGFEVVLYVSVTVLFFGYFSHGLELSFFR